MKVNFEILGAVGKGGGNRLTLPPSLGCPPAFSLAGGPAGCADLAPRLTVRGIIVSSSGASTGLQDRLLGVRV